MTLNKLPLQTSIIRTALSLLTAGLLLSACGGGTETVKNPFNNTPETKEGPPPATKDVQQFQDNLWKNIKSSDRCGGCHRNDGNSPAFADPDDVNFAYSEVAGVVDLNSPADSRMVTKVGGGHHCWEIVPQVCSDALTAMITKWANTDESIVTKRGVDLEDPILKVPGATKTYPNTAQDNGINSFENTVYPLLTENCSNCHYEEGGVQQQAPFFANLVDVDAAYAAAKAKMNVDTPENSRFVQRLLEAHNCWTDCGTKNETTGSIDGDAGEMLDAIKLFAGAITPTAVDPSLITSMALTMNDGIVASGGERHEANMIARWEFKTGTGSTAYDNSGIGTSINLTLSSNVTWLGSYGINISGDTGGARADTHDSKKIHDLVKSSGEYSIEGWVTPANVTQEDANIISYDNGSTQNNFTLSQSMYKYNFHNRTDIADTEAAKNGEPVLATEGEIAQSSLQHVVATYDPFAGRKIYVNGSLIKVTDPIDVSTSLSPWKDTFAFVLGQSAAGNKHWQGQIRMVEIHNRALTLAQITQNYEAGVGEKYFLLFSIAEQIGIPKSYIMFEVSQYDSYSYLFDKPTFINLNPDWTPGGFTIEGLRIAVNGKEAVAGQAFANMNTTIDSSYDPASGQLLSSLGAVIALEKGPESDEFFLTFETLGSKSHPHIDPIPSTPTPAADADPVSDIGIRTFEEINASISRMTNIPVTNPAVLAVYTRYQQQLPSTESIDAFLSSHQMAVAQLALTSCSERVDIDANPATAQVDKLFPDVNFGETSANAFSTATKRGYVIDPILNRVLLNNLTSSPATTEISNLLGSDSTQSLTGVSGATLTDPGGVLTDNTYSSLITELNNVDTSARTKEIVKAVCAAAVGSAAMLIQ